MTLIGALRSSCVTRTTHLLVDAEFAVCIEGLPEACERPFDAQRPVVAMDERSS